MAETANKLSDDERRAVVQWAAEFRPQNEIVRLVWQQFSKRITQQAVSHLVNSRTWALELSRQQNKFLTDYSRVPMAHRKILLQRLERLYQAADETTPHGRQERARYLGMALNALDVAHKDWIRIGQQINVRMDLADSELWKHADEAMSRMYPYMSREQLERQQAAISERLRRFGTRGSTCAPRPGEPQAIEAETADSGPHDTQAPSQS